MTIRSSTSKVILHCSFTPLSMQVDAERIRDWHVSGNGWSDIGYHIIIQPDSKLEWGRDLETIGAHVAGQNEDSIGICLVGGAKRVTIDGVSQLINANTVTEEQLETAAITIRHLKKMYPDIGDEIHGHYEYSDDKTCPNFLVSHWWETREVLDNLK